VLYAFVLSRDAQSSDVPVVPVLNIPRADLSLRPDAEWLLTEVCAHRVSRSLTRHLLVSPGCMMKPAVCGRLVSRQDSILRRSRQ
jgi:hypothetical protein